MSLLGLAALPSRVMRDVRSLQSALADVLREYVRDPSGGGTALLRRAAEIKVEIRQYFDRGGEVDWLGKSYAYRQLMTETYGMAGVLPSERKKLGDAIRYHVINVLRERLSADELDALELREADGPARAKENRERTRAIVDAATAEGRTASVVKGTPRLVKGIAATLSYVRADAIRELSDSEREELLKDAAAVRREVDRIMRVASRAQGAKSRKSR
ncbi:MAG TPA: hypothetical protein VNC22_03180 [Sporichthya sp.]|nr:hypothetical protein [Sporichthya sp.]